MTQCLLAIGEEDFAYYRKIGATSDDEKFLTHLKGAVAIPSTGKSRFVLPSGMRLKSFIEDDRCTKRRRA